MISIDNLSCCQLVTRGGTQRAVIYNGQVLCAPCPAGAIARRKARTAVACPLINGNELISNGAAMPSRLVARSPSNPKVASYTLPDRSARKNRGPRVPNGLG